MVTVKLTVSVFVRERAFACGSCRPQAACKNIKTEKLKNMNFMCTYVTAKASALRKAIKLWFIHMTNETQGDICYHWQWLKNATGGVIWEHWIHMNYRKIWMNV